MTMEAMDPPALPPLRILFLNWRCLANPRAGGAELVTQRIAEHLVRQGHQVTLFTAAFPGAKAEECMNGVRVIRRGSQLTVHWEAMRWYRGQRGAFDLVVDEINTIPFFAPLYAGVPVIAFFHQLAREVWWYEAPPGLNLLGYLAEPLYLQVYRCVPLVTVSQSSLESLRAIGLRGPACIIPEAIDIEPLDPLPPVTSKPAQLTLISLGRVVPSKRVHHAIEAVHLLRRQGIRAHLHIVGREDRHYRWKLERLVARLGLREQVTFHGRVDEAEKRRLLQEAHLLLGTSVREGWGLMVSEANALGTPAVVYDVPGLRDSTRHLETGYVCERSTPECLASSMTMFWQRPSIYAQVREQAWKWSKELRWERASRCFSIHVAQRLVSGTGGKI
jgi:glycosyltransferase involved in cell wall biosynthesis